MIEGNQQVAIDVHAITKVVETKAERLAVLHPLSLRVNLRESLAIQGESGAGKTTLLSIMAGLDLPTSGSVAWGNTELTRLNETERAKLRGQYLGFIFQSFYLVGSLTAEENVALPLILRGADAKKTRELAQAQLQAVGLAHRQRHYPQQLSGGEQQRVAVARAFVCQPTLLFADEPTGNLDEKTGQQIIDLIFQLNQGQGSTLVIITHDSDLARRCQRRVRLHDGRLIAE